MKIAYINGYVHGSKNNAFIVENGYFTNVGRKDHILRQSIDKIVDLHDQTVLPGFHDSHMHLFGLGWMLSMFDVSKYVSIAAMIDAGAKQDASPLVGRGFHEEQVKEKRMLEKKDLDRISKDKPVVIYRICGHMITANQAAIDAAREKAGDIAYDADNYDLDKGVFKEDAMKYILETLPEESEQSIKDHIKRSQDYLLSVGVTAVGSDDFSTSKSTPYETVMRAMESMAEDGSLKLNVLEQVNLPSLDLLDDFFSKGYAHKKTNNLKMGPLKLLADGSLGARSAYLREPYSDDETTQGIKIFTKEKLTALIKKAREKDMDFAIHGIGDGIIEEIIEMKEALDADGSKHRDSIIHAQLADREQIARMKAAGLGAQTQPVFLNSDIPIIKDRLGDRSVETYLFNTMVAEGVVTTISTDAPIEDANPFLNLYAATTRKSLKHPDAPPFLIEEAMDMRPAIKAYTETPAYFSYEERETGKIRKHYRADFIICEGFDENNPDSLKETRVTKTFIRGEMVYEKDDL